MGKARQRMIANIAGVHVTTTHVPGPQGVRGRSSDNTRLNQVLQWEPQVPLEEGRRVSTTLRHMIPEFTEV
jgi:nucleoside-diphosphate-sugar epimerase